MGDWWGQAQNETFLHSQAMKGITFFSLNMASPLLVTYIPPTWQVIASVKDFTLCVTS